MELQRTVGAGPLSHPCARIWGADGNQPQ